MRAYLALCVVSVVAFEINTAPFTVFKALEGSTDTQAINQMTVTCNGEGDENVPFDLVELDGGVRDVVFHCGTPELRYSRELLFFVPARVRNLVSEVCASQAPVVGNSSSALTIHNGYVVAGLKENPSLRRRGDLFKTFTEEEHEEHRKRMHTMADTGNVALGATIGLAVAGPLGALAGGLIAGAIDNDDGIDELKDSVSALQDSFSNTIEKLGALQGFQQELRENINDLSQLDQERAKLSAKNHELAAEQFDKIANAFEVQRSLTQAIANDQQRFYEYIEEDITSVEEQVGEITDLINNLVSAEVQNFENVYYQMRALANSTNYAVMNLSESITLTQQLSNAKFIELVQQVGAINTILRDLNSNRQFRNAAAVNFGKLVGMVNQTNFIQMADVPYVPPDIPAAEAQVRVESFVFAYGGGPGQLANHVEMWRFDIFSKKRYLANNIGARETWNTVLNRLGDNCTQGEPVDQYCDFWIEYQRSECLLDAVSPFPFWWNDDSQADYRYWRQHLTNYGILGPNCTGGLVIDPVQEVLNFTVFDKARVPYCVGSANGAQPTWIQTTINNRIFQVQTGTSRLECETGMLAIVAEQTLTSDFAFATVLGSIVSQIQPLVPEWDQLSVGTLPSGVTEINADLATMQDGTTGRCIYCTLVMYEDVPWVPVFLYRRVSATAELVIDVSGNGMPAEQYTKTINQMAGIDVSFPEYYPERFVGVGMTWLMLNSPEQFVYDVPWSELNTGDSFQRAGTGLYIYSPDENPINVTKWENLNHAYFDHNAASVGIDRDIAPTVLSIPLGKFICSGDPPITKPAVTTPSLCRQMDDAGWIEEGTFNDPYANDVVAILQPASSQYTVTVEIPSGTFILNIGSSCPIVTATPRQEGGASALIENGSNLTVSVLIEPFGSCFVPEEQLLLGAKAVIQRPYPVCIEGISVSREVSPSVFEFCANTSFAEINAIAPVQIGIYNDALDATYSQKLTTTMTDDIMVSTADLSSRLAALQSDMLQLMMKTIIQTVGVKVNATLLDEMYVLLDQAEALANNSVARQRDGRNNANFTFTDTTDLFDALDNITTDIQKRNENITRNNDEINRINDEAADKIEDIINVTSIVAEAEKEFLAALNETGNILIDFANGLIDVLEGQDIDWDDVAGLLVAAGEGIQSLGDYIVDVINEVGGLLIGGIPELAISILTIVGVVIGLVAVGAVIYTMVKMGLCKGGGSKPSQGTSSRHTRKRRHRGRSYNRV